MPNPLQQLLNQRQQRQSHGIMGGIKPVKMANGGLVPSGGLPYGSPRGALGGYGGMGLGTGMGYAEGGEATDIDLEDLEPETQNKVIEFIKEHPWATAVDIAAIAAMFVPLPGARIAAGARAVKALAKLSSLRHPIKATKAGVKAAKTAVEKAVGKRVARKQAAPGFGTGQSPLARGPGGRMLGYQALGREAIGKSNIPARIGAGTVLAAGTLPFIGDEETLAVSEAPQDLGDVVEGGVPETSTFWEKAKAFPQDFWKRMQTDENFRRQAMAGFVNMGKFTEGYVPRSGLTDFTEGMATEAARQEGGMSEAEKTIGLIRSMGADMTDKDILSLVLGVPTGDSNRDRLKAAIGSTDPNAYDRVLVKIKEEIYRNVDPEYTAQDYAIVKRGEEGAIELVPDSELVNIILAEGTDVLKNKSFTVMTKREYKKLKKT